MHHRNSSPRAILTLSLIALLLAQAGVQAHDGPEETIKHLTEHIEESGPTPRLLYQRATEHRAIGELASAVRDLEQALTLHANYVPALAELSEAYLAMNRPADSLRLIDHALELPTKEDQRSPFYLIRATALKALNRNQEALAACERAFSRSPIDPDGYLLRGEIQASLGQHHARAKGLAEGYQRTGGAVLEEEWVEAMIDAGQFKDALEQIQPHLARSRWRSPWLLRQARAELGLGRTAPAQTHLAEAVAEINLRLNPARPDLFLLADRGLASALLGNPEQARRDLAAAEKLGARQWVVTRLRQALK